MRHLIFVLIIIITGLTPTFAQTTTAADVIASNGSLSTLLTAVDTAGLTPRLTSGEVTVFAPTNIAFSALLRELGVTQQELLADTVLLRQVLNYHIVPSQITLGTVRDAGSTTVTPLSGGSIQADFINNRVVLNGGRAVVTNPNQFASNGVVHIINAVLLPPALIPTPPVPPTPPVVTTTPRTITNIAATNPNLSLFVTAMRTTGLDSELANGTYTVFIPDNAAFSTLLNELGLSEAGLLGDLPLLRSVLTYHVTPGYLMSDDLARIGGGAIGPSFNGKGNLDGIGLSLQRIPTLNGRELAVSVDGSRVVLDNGRAIVTVIDIYATNGVFHVVNNVLLP